MPLRDDPGSAPALVVVTGPTAVGKTRLAIELALHYQTIIISADSRQFFHQLKIGTAAPTRDELATVPHFLAGHLSVNDYYNVSKFESDVLGILNGQFSLHNPVILAGGSGLYIDAVCRGIDDLPDADPQIREQTDRWLKDWGLEYLQEKLKELDPEYFAIVDKNNPNRLKRAIEVCLMTGKTYSSLRVNQPKYRDFKIIKIGLNLPREELFQRISLRTEKMIGAGLVEEVRSLAVFRSSNALNTVGYKEIFEYLDGTVSLEQAIENIKTNTRRYAKRQLTWLKRDKEIKWFAPHQIELIINYIDERMESRGLQTTTLKDGN